MLITATRTVAAGPPAQISARQTSPLQRGRSGGLLAAAASSLVLMAIACGGSTGAGAGQQASSAAPDSNPGGDIPDTQAYVSFTAPSGAFTVKVPEGWGRSQQAGATVFADKLNAVRLEAVSSPAAPTAESATATELPTIRNEVKGFRPGTVTTVNRAGGSAILITYQSESAPDPVTGKTVRDAVERYEFWRAGTEAIVTLSSPRGADNVDPWRIVTDSFRWS
jgi:hypothetical protein